MSNIYIKSIVLGIAGVAGAYVLNLVLKWNEDASASYWAILAVAFVVGTYIGLRVSANRKKKD